MNSSTSPSPQMAEELIRSSGVLFLPSLAPTHLTVEGTQTYSEHHYHCDGDQSIKAHQWPLAGGGKGPSSAQLWGKTVVPW